MAETNETIVTIRAQKSSAPIICGLIGFIMGIPAVACSLLCGAAAVGIAGATDAASQIAASGTADADVAAGAEALSSVASATDDVATAFLAYVAISWVAGFILSFFGKSKISGLTGALTMLAGAAMLVLSVIQVNFWGITTGILYVISGGIAIGNKRKA